MDNLVLIRVADVFDRCLRHFILRDQGLILSRRLRHIFCAVVPVPVGFDPLFLAGATTCILTYAVNCQIKGDLHQIPVGVCNRLFTLGSVEMNKCFLQRFLCCVHVAKPTR